MARRNEDAALATRTSRAKFPAEDTIRWRVIEKGKLHVGYRRRLANVAGLWLARSYVGDGKYSKTTIGTADDFEPADGLKILDFYQAQQAAIAMAKARGKIAKTPAGPLTVAMLADDYLRHLEAAGSKSVADAERRIKAHILPHFGSRRADSLTTAELNAWRDAMANSPPRLRTAKGQPQRYRAGPMTSDQRRARRSSTNRCVAILRSILNLGFRAGRLNDDLQWRRLKKLPKADAARKDHLSIEEARRLVNAADAASGFRDLVRAALATGCRFGELARLTVGDFQRGRIVVRVSKTGKSRDVRLQPDAIAFFTQLCAGRKPDEIMLRRADGGPWKEASQTRPMRAACVAAGLKPVGIHALRHSWASQAVMGGLPMVMVAQALGHSTTRMTEAHYAHLVASFEDEMFARHAPKFGETPPETNVVPMPVKGAK